MSVVNIALIGINGFGSAHLKVASRLEQEGLLRLRAVCETNIDACADKLTELRSRGVKAYADYLAMLAAEPDLDIVAVATPIHLHREMAVRLLEHGCDVLLEKPPAVTIQDLDAMLAVQAQAGRLCQVDFMHAAEPAFRELRRRVTAGELGRIRTIRGQGLWQRHDDYYTRTPWAGKLTVRGRYVLDGTINNPLAHLLNNMLLLAGDTAGFAVRTVTGELYHAHAIEAEDTSCLRVTGANGLTLLYYATLCQPADQTPHITVDGTLGSAEWDYDGNLHIKRTGTVQQPGPVSTLAGIGDNQAKIALMYRNLIDVRQGRSDRLFCSLADTRNFVLAANGAFESSGQVHAIPATAISRYPAGDSVATAIRDIEALISRASREDMLFAETGASWAVPGRPVDMAGYREFKLFRDEVS